MASGLQPNSNGLQLRSLILLKLYLNKIVCLFWSWSQQEMASTRVWIGFLETSEGAALLGLCSLAFCEEGLFNASRRSSVGVRVPPVQMGHRSPSLASTLLAMASNNSKRNSIEMASNLSPECTDGTPSKSTGRRLGRFEILCRD